MLGLFFNHSTKEIKMIVQRITIQVKSGKMDQALALAKEGRRNVWPFFKSSKIYSANIGPLGTIAFESEFENLTEFEVLWTRLGATEAWASWLAKWSQLVTEQGTNELWNLEEG
jgi:hypothetical protein